MWTWPCFNGLLSSYSPGNNVLKTMAEELSKGVGLNEGTCSSGWLSGLNALHNIMYRTLCGENNAVDQEVCNESKRGHYCHSSRFVLLMIFLMPSRSTSTCACYQARPMLFLGRYALESRNTCLC